MLIGSIQAGAYTYGIYGVPRQRYSAEPVEPVQSVGRSWQGHTAESISWLEMLTSHATLYNTVHNTPVEPAGYAGRGAYARNNASSRGRYDHDRTGGSVDASAYAFAEMSVGAVRRGTPETVRPKDTASSPATSETDVAGASPFARLLRNVTATTRHVARSRGGDAVSQMQADFTESVTAAADELTGTGQSDHDRLLERIDEAFKTLNDSLRRQFSHSSGDDEHDERADEIEQTLDSSPLGLETLRQVFGSEVQELKDAIKAGTVVPKNSQPPQSPSGNYTVSRFDAYSATSSATNPQYDDRTLLNAVA